jgi:large subunit ribosomal protein L1
MKMLPKRLNSQKILLEQKQIYPIKEAIEKLKNFQPAKFLETVEAHISLNIDPKYNNQQLRTTLTFPKGTGKNLKIAIVTSDDLIKMAIEEGADIAGSENLIEDITNEVINFDILIATPEQMPKLAKLGRILGPKGLMPSPKSGTVTKDLSSAIKEFKKGKIEYRADKNVIVHVPVGKINYTTQLKKINLLVLRENILEIFIFVQQ